MTAHARFLHSDQQCGEGGEQHHPHDGAVEAEEGDEDEASQERAEAAAEKVRRVEGSDHGLLVADPVEARVCQDAGDEKAGDGEEQRRRHKAAGQHATLQSRLWRLPGGRNRQEGQSPTGACDVAGGPSTGPPR